MYMDAIKFLMVIGTRPEAIKMAPVIKAFKAVAEFEIKICVTAQHRQMLDQVLNLFNIVPDFDLNLMKPGQDLTDVTCNVLIGMKKIFQQWKPDWVFVHGDTTTTISASLAAFYEKISVAHIEAGLRTGDIYSPWPEEMNRRLTTNISLLHFAPTKRAKDNLLKDGVLEQRVIVTGNTVIDALFQALKILRNNHNFEVEFEKKFSYLDAKKRLILVTGHRRENFGENFEKICQALKKISKRGDVEILYPVHLNPNVQEPVQRILGDEPHIHLVQPLDYLPFIYVMSRSYLIITDSGGIQEEAPSLGKPVLVLRETTERPEALEAGVVKLVGTATPTIISNVFRMLDDSDSYKAMSQTHNPYGDGLASEKIVKFFKKKYFKSL